MIGMGMGDDGLVDGAPGVDVEVSGRAVDAILSYLNYVHNLPYQFRKAGMES
jgi:hypothetical protein